jgi:hypothetical protein
MRKNSMTRALLAGFSALAMLAAVAPHAQGQEKIKIGLLEDISGDLALLGMPKLHGSARKLSGVLNTLAKFAKDNELPLTQNKVERMQKRLKDEGFTSFAEN